MSFVLHSLRYLKINNYFEHNYIFRGQYLHFKYCSEMLNKSGLLYKNILPSYIILN